MNVPRVLATLLLETMVLTGCVAPGGPTTAAPPGMGLPDTAEILFTTDRTSLQPGECAVLRWDVRVDGPFMVALNEEPAEPMGERQVCPQETTTYVLSVDTGKELIRRELTIATADAVGPSPQQPAVTAAGGTALQNLKYGSYTLGGQEHNLLLDLYLPQSTAVQPTPLIVYIHGGGWIEGSKDRCPAKTFTRQGYAVACVDYRLAAMEGGCQAELLFPAQIHDVKAAVRWLRQNASVYRLDPNGVAALGNSSGGHLASLLGVSYGITELEGSGTPGISDAVQAVVDWYGPVDVTQPPPQLVFTDDPCDSGFGALGARYGGEATRYFYWTFAWEAFLGGSLADPTVIEQARRATPLTYVDASDPPFLIIHGEMDDMVPIEQSELLAEALEAAGVQVTFVRAPGGHSYGQPGGEIDPLFLQPTLQFLDKYLKGQP